MEKHTLLATRGITLEMHDPIRKIRAEGGNETAAHAFHSLFLWQKDMELSICLQEDAFAVHCGYWGENSWFFPCGKKEAAVRLAGEILEADPMADFRYLREADTALLQEYWPGRFRIEAAEDASEYLYDREAYLTMPGKSYEDIRWSINHLKKNHGLKTEILEDGNMDTAREVLDRWIPYAKSSYFSEDLQTAELMMENLKELEMMGVIVFLDGEPAALAAGFPVSEHSYDVAFSKSLARERGLQFYVRRELIARLPEQYTVINGEEDLGIPGLRQSKQLENPVGRIEMFRAYAK